MTVYPNTERKPVCVLSCPTSARIYGDIHDPESEASKAISDAGGYQLMPEWGTAARQSLPAATQNQHNAMHPEDLQRVDNPLRKEDRGPRANPARAPRLMIQPRGDEL